MSLEKQINEDMKKAMKAGDKAAMRALRAVKSAIQLAKAEKGESELSPDREMAILQKQVKQRKDSLAIYEKENRPDLAQKEAEEIAVLERYLPQPLTEEELEAELKRIIAEVGATSMKDMGKVMGKATKELAGRADGKTISTKVRQLLSA
ncbi:MAG: GatB/YqeY domain-containing protein [Bacteroidetes bacterium]|nr:MAG: GatB/YqeY domain-containing protein [Bacteroidota bacterium]